MCVTRNKYTYLLNFLDIFARNYDVIFYRKELLEQYAELPEKFNICNIILNHMNAYLDDENTAELFNYITGEKIKFDLTSDAELKNSVIQIGIQIRNLFQKKLGGYYFKKIEKKTY